MNALTYACCLAVVASPAFAGEAAPAVAKATPPPHSPSNWFIGAGADYLFDADEDYWNGHIGYNFDAANSIFLEVGWIGAKEDYNYGHRCFKIVPQVDVDIIPVTINYKYEWGLTENLSWYIGGGIGFAYADIDVDAHGFAPDLSDSEWRFMAQAFTGLVYEFTPSFEMYLGFRYMWIDEYDLIGDDLDDFTIGTGIRATF